MFDSLAYLSSMAGVPAWLLAIVVIWSLSWKGVALWRSARKGHSIWFVLLLVLQTMGIAEILYIFLFSKINLDETSSGKKVGKKRKNANKI